MTDPVLLVSVLLEAACCPTADFANDQRFFGCDLFLLVAGEVAAPAVLARHAYSVVLRGSTLAALLYASLEFCAYAIGGHSQPSRATAPDLTTTAERVRAACRHDARQTRRHRHRLRAAARGAAGARTASVPRHQSGRSPVVSDPQPARARRSRDGEVP